MHLKLLADAALVGLPNAGKSSLLRRISNARPKVADYPFTTLAPVLGTVEAPDGRQLVVADVPGLIEGASEGVGLGHEFLAHLERARLLLHVIDSAAGDADERWRTIDAELAAYGAGLDERPQIVVLNKTDLSPSRRRSGSRTSGSCASSASRPPPAPASRSSGARSSSCAADEDACAEPERGGRRSSTTSSTGRGRRAGLPRLPHRARLSRHRHARPRAGELEAILQAAGAARATRSRSATRCSSGMT